MGAAWDDDARVLRPEQRALQGDGEFRAQNPQEDSGTDGTEVNRRGLDYVVRMCLNSQGYWYFRIILISL